MTLTAMHNCFGRLGASFHHKKADRCGADTSSSSMYLLVQDILEVCQVSHIPGGQMPGSI
jgi:hypothetical protein